MGGTKIPFGQPFVQPVDGFFVQDVGIYFELVRHPGSIPLNQEIKNPPRMLFIQVECSVEELDLPHAVVDQILQVLENMFLRKITHAMLQRRQAIRTSVRATAQSFEINNLVREFRLIFLEPIRGRQCGQAIRDGAVTATLLPAPSASNASVAGLTSKVGVGSGFGSSLSSPHAAHSSAAAKIITYFFILF